LEEEKDEEKSKLERELTEKYLSNEITFKDYVRQIAPDNDSDNESDEDVKGPDSSEEIDDSDWVPSPTKKHKKDQPDKSKRKRNDFDDNDVDQSPESQFAKDLKHATRQQLGKKRQRLGIAPRKKRLDPALQGLMGEANLRFARGDTDTAIRMCMEVIRQEPGVPEPFQTLSTLYEETGNEEKAFQFALIAAHLAPQDAEEWGRLADMSLEHGDRKQAVACFRKAVDADPQCLKYHWSRCDLLEQLGEKSKALMAFKRMLSVLKGISENPEENEEFDPAEIGIEYIRAAREAARLYHEKTNVEDARKVIQEAINLHPSSAENGDINLLLDLLMSEKMYEDAMQVICEHCDAKFEAAKKQSDLSQLESDQQLQEFTAIRLPESTPVEIYSKVIIILLQLNACHLIPEIAQVLLDEDTEEFGDLMLDVAEAYMSKENYQESLKFLEKLVNSVNYSQAAVWLQYGESLYGVGKLEDAEMAYKKVVALAPQHHDARRSLSSILNELGRPDEALLTLDQDEEAELLNPSLLYEKCNLLYSEERMDEFASKAELLLSRHFTQIRNKEEMYAIAAQKRLNKKTKAIAEVRSFRQEPLLDQREADFEADTVITLSKEYELFHKLCEFYYQNKKYSELQRLTFSALGSPLFNKSEETMKECEFLCLVASFSNGDSYHAYNFVRDMVVKDANNNRLWNLFNLVISRAEDLRHNRFLMRFMSRRPDNLALGILNGHNCLVAGTYKYSLGEYMSAFKQDRGNNPLIALMLGLTFVHMACQKFSARKHSLVVQACAFLNTYVKLRGKCQETFYNLGRAMHQLGILPAALHYYKKALEVGPIITPSEDISKNSESQDNIYDLSRETAHNIALIYQSSGNKDLARMYLHKYIVV